MCRWVREEGRRSRKEKPPVRRSGGPIVFPSSLTLLRTTLREAKEPSLQPSENSPALFLLSCRQQSRQPVSARRSRALLTPWSLLLHWACRQRDAPAGRGWTRTTLSQREAPCRSGARISQCSCVILE